MKVYFISGLGADEKAFQLLQLPGVEPVHLNWMPPLKKESIDCFINNIVLHKNYFF